MLNHDLRVGNYARVSGDKQAKDGTIASQLEAIRERIASDGLECEPELSFVDDGYSGDSLVRPGLERLRDQAAAGVIDGLRDKVASISVIPDTILRAVPVTIDVKQIQQPEAERREALALQT